MPHGRGSVSDALLFMSLRHSNGNEVTLQEWNGLTAELMNAWVPDFDEGMGINTITGAWVDLFAQRLRQICEDHNVPLEIVRANMPPFQKRVAPHMRRFQHFLSEQQGDVGLRGAAKAAGKSAPQKIGDHLVEFHITFPAVSSGSAHEESIEFQTDEGQRAAV